MPKAKHLGTDPEPNALIPLNKRDGAYVNLTALLWTGCPVALLYRNKRFKPKFGRYYPGPPVEFAEFVDPWDNSKDAKLRKRRPVSGIAHPVLLLGMQRKYPPGINRLPKRRWRKGEAHA